MKKFFSYARKNLYIPSLFSVVIWFLEVIFFKITLKPKINLISLEGISFIIFCICLFVYDVSTFDFFRDSEYKLSYLTRSIFLIISALAITTVSISKLM